MRNRRAPALIGWAFLLALPLGAPAALAGGGYLNLDDGTGGISNVKALQVGDIVTIVIVESASANATAKTDANAKTEVSGGPGLGMLNLVSDWGLTAENKFKGDGKSIRTGDLNARISTRVVEILPNGNYRLKGDRFVEINGERQKISLSGIIRPSDLKANNVIESTYVADANITYTGKGPIAEAHSPGILSRIVNLIF